MLRIFDSKQQLFESRLRYYLFTKDKLKYRKETVMEIMKNYEGCKVPANMKARLEKVLS